MYINMNQSENYTEQKKPTQKFIWFYLQGLKSTKLNNIVLEKETQKIFTLYSEFNTKFRITATSGGNRKMQQGGLIFFFPLRREWLMVLDDETANMDIPSKLNLQFPWEQCRWKPNWG